jgi:hypothetical protein
MKRARINVSVTPAGGHAALPDDVTDAFVPVPTPATARETVDIRIADPNIRIGQIIPPAALLAQRWAANAVTPTYIAGTNRGIARWRARC